MRKLKTGLIGLIFILLPMITTAQGGNLGMGFVVGEPTAISLKINQPRNHAITLRSAWQLGENPDVYFSGDFTFYNHSLLEIESGNVSMPVYYGIGGWAKVDDFSRFGGRIPLGISLQLDNTPVGFFLEMAPVLTAYPETAFDMRGGIGVHIYP